VTKRIREKLDPQWMFYESQKLRVRITRLIEAFERLTGARPGERLHIDFEATRLEHVIHRAGVRLALGAAAGAALFTASRLIESDREPKAIPAALGTLGGVLAARLLVDVVRSDDHA
jgi:ubiquinone biosynthesis protein